MRKLSLLAIATVALLAVGCADADAAADRTVMKNGINQLQEQVKDLEATVESTDATDSISRLQEQVQSLEAALERIENTPSAGATLSSADTRNIWQPPADITKDMDPFEAAALCLTDKLFSTRLGGELADEVLESFTSEIGATEDEWMDQMGPALRYLFCGF